jgi:hypothetical protein
MTSYSTWRKEKTDDMKDTEKTQSSMTEQDLIQQQLRELLEEPTVNTHQIPESRYEEGRNMSTASAGGLIAERPPSSVSYKYKPQHYQATQPIGSTASYPGRTTPVVLLRQIQFYPNPIKYILSCEVEKLMGLQPGTIYAQESLSQRLVNKEEQTILQSNRILTELDLKYPVTLINAEHILRSLAQRKTFTLRTVILNSTLHDAESKDPALSGATSNVAHLNKPTTLPQVKITSSMDDSSTRNIESRAMMVEQHDVSTGGANPPELSSMNTKKILYKEGGEVSSKVESFLQENRPIGRFTAMLQEPLNEDDKKDILVYSSVDEKRESTHRSEDDNKKDKDGIDKRELSTKFNSNMELLKRKRQFCEINDELLQKREKLYQSVAKRDAERTKGLFTKNVIKIYDGFT